MSGLFEHRRRQAPKPRQFVEAPDTLMIVDFDSRTHDPRNTAHDPNARTPRVPAGGCEFIREGRAWIGDR